MATLVMLCGLPRSGKTTAAAVMRQKGAPVVCVDQVRLAVHNQRYEQLAEPLVWAIAKIMVRALFGAGHQTVILDATNTTRKRRDEWIDPEWERLFVLVETPVAVCLDRARAEGDAYIVPIIERQAAAFEPVQREEGPLILWSVGRALPEPIV